MIGFLLGLSFLAASPEWTAIVAVEGALLTLEETRAAPLPTDQSPPPVSRTQENATGATCASGSGCAVSQPIATSRVESQPCESAPRRGLILWRLRR